MKTEKINLGLTGYDDLFMSSEEREDMKKPKVEEIFISDLRPFKDHPLCHKHILFVLHAPLGIPRADSTYLRSNLVESVGI